MLAGSPPRAITTGIFSPRAAISRQCAAPDLVTLPVHRQRVAAEHLDPVHPDVADAAGRVGGDHHRQRDVPTAVPGPGREERDPVEVDRRRPGARPPGRRGRPPRIRGGNLAISASLGSIDSLPNSPSGTLRWSSSAIRPPISSSRSTPRARQIRRIEPKQIDRDRDAGSGCRLRGARCSKRSAGPPPGSSCSDRRSRRSRAGRGPAGGPAPARPTARWRR